MHVILPLTKGHLSNKAELFAEDVFLLEEDHCSCKYSKYYSTGSSSNSNTVVPLFFKTTHGTKNMCSYLQVVLK